MNASPGMLSDSTSVRDACTPVQVWSFASGSDGNCYVVESEGTSLLVECGRPYTQVKEFLEGIGIEPEELSGILLTHAHGDHSRSARSFSQTHGTPIFASRGPWRANLDDLTSRVGHWTRERPTRSARLT